MSVFDEMAMEIAEDEDLGGKTAIYHKRDGTVLALTVRFIEPFQMAEAGSQKVSGLAPMVAVPRIRLSDARQGDEIVVEGRRYVVVTAMPDGAAFTNLTLSGPIPDP